MAKSTIEWTEFTWNTITGCNRVSEGCRFCYAEQQSPLQKARYLGTTRKAMARQVGVLHERSDLPEHVSSEIYDYLMEVMQ